MVLKDRWYVLSAMCVTAVASAHWTAVALTLADEAQVRRGLAWYAVGCATLALALAFSLSKARQFHRFWTWLEGTIPPVEPAVNPPNT